MCWPMCTVVDGVVDVAGCMDAVRIVAVVGYRDAVPIVLSMLKIDVDMVRRV